MALSYSFIFTLFAFSAVVLAGPGGRHGHGGGGFGGAPQLPPFLQNVTAEGRQAFFAIVSNTSLTISETESQISSWAQTYGVSVSRHVLQSFMNCCIYIYIYIYSGFILVKSAYLNST